MAINKKQTKIIAIKKKSKNNCWNGCGEIGALVEM
jgi:hypothetical protein